MATISRKREVGIVNGTPNKRLFWSIISDYDLRTAICELIDNAIDHWVTAGRKKHLIVSLELDVDRQLISIQDNAGGVASGDLHVLVAPGGSLNDPLSAVIGVFGVGGKRAGVALGEYVEIRTRKARGPSMAIEITPEWLESADWDLPKYEVPDVPNGSTEVRISHLRRPFRENDVESLRQNLGETYASFIEEGCMLELNGTSIKAQTFNSWAAFPPKYPPSSFALDGDFGSDGQIVVEITGGLIVDRNPEAENYGVYFYCNDRLIVKDLKVRDVGYFAANEAGVPHPDASLCRVIVRMKGSARLMPWTSNKSGINYDHPVFQKLRPQLIQLVSYYTKLSRRTKDDWRGKPLGGFSGTVEPATRTSVGGKLALVPLPKANKSHVDQLKSKNAKELKAQPWTLGLVEAIAAVDILERQKLDTRNRMALILLDSNFEIALKEFIVHRTDLFPVHLYNDAKIQQLFAKRYLVVNEIKAKIPSLSPYLAKVSHYYLMRNKLIHERATVDIPASDVANYRQTIQEILGILFNLKFPK